MDAGIKYDNIRLEPADNGIRVSFTYSMKNENDGAFEPRMHRSKEYVYQHKDIEDAFKLVRDLVTYNMKGKKGEKTDPVKLPH